MSWARRAALTLADAWSAWARITPNSSPPSRPTMSDSAGIVDERARHRVQRRVARGVAQRVVDPLQAVQVEEQHAMRRVVALDMGHDARQLAHEGAPVGDRQQRVLVGQLLELGDALLRRVELAAQALGFLDQRQDRGFDLGGEFRLGDAEHGGDVLGRNRAAGRTRRGTSGFVCTPNRARRTCRARTPDLHPATPYFRCLRT